MISSARPRIRSRQFFDRYYADNIAISTNGTDIYDFKKEESLFIAEIESDFLKDLYLDCINHPTNNTRIRLVTGNYSYTNRMKYDYETLFPKDMTNFFSDKVFSQATIVGKDFDYMKKLMEKVACKDNIIVPHHSSCLVDSSADTSHIFFDVTVKGVNKGKAVKKVCEHLSISPEKIISIGDGRNDISMFKESGLAVAVDNALDIVKKEADIIIGANNKDGVAIFLEELAQNNFKIQK